MNSSDTRPRGRKRWSLLSSRQQNRLRYVRARWVAAHDGSRQAGAARLREARNKTRISQNDLAKLVDVSLTTVKRWESGQHPFPVSVLKVLCTLRRERKVA